MKKQLFAALIAITIGSTAAKAQMPYSVTVKNEPYQALTGTTSVNGSTIWDDDNYIIPLGFNFDFGGKTMTNLNQMGGIGMGTDTGGIIQYFAALHSDMIDRGSLGSASKSPIRYAVTGTPGNKIFKLELLSAGFADEMYLYNSLNDSVNLQIWLYEATSAIEIHFGTSQITHPTDYFFTNGPMIGYAKNMDMDQGEFDKLYLLKGNPTAPTIDSVPKNSTNFHSLSSYPASGTVYTFAPKNATSVNDIMATKITVFPTQCTDAIYIQNEDIPNTYYQVVSTTGVVMKKGKVENGRNRVDVSNLSAGMYMVRVDNVIGYDLKKFVKF